METYIADLMVLPSDYNENGRREFQARDSLRPFFEQFETMFIIDRSERRIY